MNFKIKKMEKNYSKLQIDAKEYVERSKRRLYTLALNAVAAVLVIAIFYFSSRYIMRHGGTDYAAEYLFVFAAVVTAGFMSLNAFVKLPITVDDYELCDAMEKILQGREKKCSRRIKKMKPVKRNA